MGSGPRFVDFDGDGHLDLWSGSYDPGEIYLFRGEGKGKFKARETLVDKNGKSILLCPNQKVKWESFGSSVVPVDWDSDGDIDLLIGGAPGDVLLRLNEGTRAKPVFAADNVKVMAGEKQLQVSGHYSTPVVADWDGDGKWDIVTGSADGGIYWYRNMGTADRPAFESVRTLLPKHAGSGYNEFLDVGQEPKPGIRTQVCVVDLNGDGKLDLIVGDFSSTISPRGDLSEDDRTVLRRMMTEYDERLARDAKLREQVQEELGNWEKKTFSEDEAKTDAAQERINKKYKELAREQGLEKLQEECGARFKELSRYLAKPARQVFDADDMSTAHGFVWLFLRK